MTTMLLISFIVFIVLPMICSALFLVARVCGIYNMERVQQTKQMNTVQTVEMKELYATTASSWAAC